MLPTHIHAVGRSAVSVPNACATGVPGTHVAAVLRAGPVGSSVRSGRARTLDLGASVWRRSRAHADDRVLATPVDEAPGCSFDQHAYNGDYFHKGHDH
jgi:hypothetical protein